MFPRRHPPKSGVFDGAVASFRAKKLTPSLRARRDDFTQKMVPKVKIVPVMMVPGMMVQGKDGAQIKLAISNGSSMKGLSTMQKETKIKTFLASPNESESRGRRRTWTILTASTASV